MTETPATPRYGVYFKAWLALLGLTLLMVCLPHHPGLLIAGMCAKAVLIALFFMHLRYERLDFALTVTLSIVLCSLILFGLIAPDGMAM